MKIEELLLESLLNVLDNSDGNESDLVKIDDEFNILQNLESISIVDMILDIEEKIEKEYGIYITLADDKLFHYQDSPMNSWSLWVKFVKSKLP
tara:strand:- start:1727 stop:2005 length:279 start_codon:yes stop_codon:yes gene_type:complete